MQIVAVLVAIAATIAAVDILALKILGKVLWPLNTPRFAKVLKALRG